MNNRATPAKNRCTTHLRRVEDNITRQVDEPQRTRLLLWDCGETDTPVEIIVTGQNATTFALAFMVRYGSGLIRVAMTDDNADRLDLPTMYLPGTRNQCSRDTVAVDAREGVTTGISANDRSRTVRVLADPRTTPDELTLPGHVIPVRASNQGEVVSLPSVALAATRRAGLPPVVAMCSLVSEIEPLSMAALAEGENFADAHQLSKLYASHYL